MISTGLSLAVLTATGFYMIYRKLPGSVRRFLHRHPLLTDSIACLLTYSLFGGTLVALFAAAWVGVIVSIMLAITSNPEMNAMLEKFVQRIITLKTKFVEWMAEQNETAEQAK